MVLVEQQKLPGLLYFYDEKTGLACT